MSAPLRAAALAAVLLAACAPAFAADPPAAASTVTPADVGARAAIAAPPPTAAAPAAPTAGTAPAVPKAPAPAPPLATGRPSPSAAPAGADLVTPAPPATQVPAIALPDTGAPRADTGRDIYLRFRAGLADPTCAPGTGTRWQQHFAHVPSQLSGGRSGELLPLFGYVVDALRDAHLPTEYALIPFVESGYRPAARSASGPAGLWQFIAVTARNHRIAIRPGYDGRLSPVDSTQAAVRYLKTLHGMFAGDWRLAVMAYNAGEYRVLGALKRHGQRAADAEPAALDSLAPVTRAYVRKLHALSCVLADADDAEAWMRALDRPVPRLRAVDIPPASTLEAWARGAGVDAGLLKRLNPALADGRVPQGARALAPLPAAAVPAATVAAGSADADTGADAVRTVPTVAASQQAAVSARTHTVVRGDSASRIAQRHGVRLDALLARNGLDARSVLRPGMVLVLDAAGDAATTVAN